MAEQVHGTKQTGEAARKRQLPAPAMQGPAALMEQSALLTAGVQRAVANPRLAHPVDILGLQRAAGNRAVVQLVQAKLTVGQAGDRCEKADCVAEQVVSGQWSVGSVRSAVSGQSSVQRAAEEEEEIQTRPTAILTLQHTIGDCAVTGIVQPHTVSLTTLQRDIAKGSKLPTLEAMTKSRFGELLGPEFRKMQSEADEMALAGAQFYVNDWMFMMGVFRAVASRPLKPDEPEPTFEDLTLAETILQQNVKGAKDWGAFVESCIKDEVKIRKMTKGAGLTVSRIINEFFKQVHEQGMQVAKLTTSRRSERGYAPGATSAQETANAFLTARQNVRIGGTPQEYKQQKPAFAKALKQMPTVRRLLRTYKAGKMPSAGKAQWKNGGKLSDDISESKVNDAKNEKGKVVRKNVDNGKFKRRTDQADEFVKAMVEPSLLAMLNRPKVFVHLKYSSAFSKVNAFRAFQNGSEVHMAQDEDTPVIVHEVGHYLEDHLPSELWHDIRLLMEARHTAAGGGAKAVKGISSKEGGYKGKYLDVYMAKAYGGRGSTEVMSMTMEYLADPNRIKTMLNKDPQQAAIILRGILPKEYAAIDALRAFDKFLPNQQP